MDLDGAGSAGTHVVYCDMTTASGAWTVFKNAEVGSVSGLNNAWLTDKQHVIAYINVSGTIGYTVLSQLTAYTGTDLQVTHNGTFTRVYFAPGVVSGSINGFHTNSTYLSFTNCDTNPSSSFTFYQAGYSGGGSPYTLESSWRGSRIAYGQPIPAAYFGNVTVAFGGCGAYTSNVGYTVAFGLR